MGVYSTELMCIYAHDTSSCLGFLKCTPKIGLGQGVELLHDAKINALTVAGVGPGAKKGIDTLVQSSWTGASACGP